jgi:hypothetical protein
MMIRTLAAAIAVAFLTAGSLSSPAKAKDAEVSLSAAKQKPAKRHVVRRSGGNQIACTVYGCHPIPARCHPQTEFDWWGNPTGYDAVACR